MDQDRGGFNPGFAKCQVLISSQNSAENSFCNLVPLHMKETERPIFHLANTRETPRERWLANTDGSHDPSHFICESGRRHFPEAPNTSTRLYKSPLYGFLKT